MSWRKRVGITLVIWAAALNVAWLAVSLIWLGRVAGWTSPERTKYPEWVGYGIPLIQFMLLAYLFDQGFRFFLRRWIETEALGRPPPRLGLQLGRLLIYFTFGAMTISLVFNQSITGILAASGVIGLVAGFALRGLVADLFFGIALHIDRNISIGDWVDIAYRGRELSGEIHDIHWRSVILRNLGGNIVLIPNSEFASAAVTNHSKPFPTAEYSTTISVGHEYESGRILAVLEGVLATLRDEHLIFDSPSPRVQIAQVESGLVRYRLYYSASARLGASQEIQSTALRYALQYLRSAGCNLYPMLPNYVNPDKALGDRPQDIGVRLRTIGNLPLFRVLPPSAIDIIVQETKIELYAAGHVLIHAGQPGDTMWILVEGALDVMVDQGGQQVHVATLWPGDWVGEMTLLTGEPRNATVIAQKPAMLHVISKPTMEKIFSADPEIVTALAQIAGRRRKKRNDQFQTISTSQDNAKTKSTISRIKAFFGLTLPA